MGLVTADGSGRKGQSASGVSKVNSVFSTRGVRALLCGSLAAAGAVACGSEPSAQKTDSVELGVILPFTGREAALGRNIEQALILAVEDVNAAGGAGSKPLSLVTRDSHSGSERGVDELLDLLYTDEVKYLIGPEETELANEVVRDVKALNIFNMLPGYAAPKIERSGSSGAWMRLAPSTFMVGCAMAKFAVKQGADTLNTLASTEDYNLALSNELVAQFRSAGGTWMPSVTVDPETESFKRPLSDVFESHPDRTALIASPGTAAEIVTEWVVGGRHGHWYLSPLLRAEAFLFNVPFGSIDGTYGLSPSSSLPSECAGIGGEQGSVKCTHKNSDRFAEHFSDRWDGDRPLPASRLYYDSVVLVAMGMRYAMAVDGKQPTATRLHQLIRNMNASDSEPAQWYALEKAMKAVDGGEARRYVGAGTEYSFDEYGAAKHVVYDVWKVKGQGFVETGSFYVDCKEIL
jgi:neutral amino acid transport system substrate-binding protein